MIVAFFEAARVVDQIAVALAIAGFTAMIHGAAYNAAEGALRLQRVLLKRGADVVVVGAVVAIVEMFAG